MGTDGLALEAGATAAINGSYFNVSNVISGNGKTAVCFRHNACAAVDIVCAAVIAFELCIWVRWNALGTARHGNDYDGIINISSVWGYP